MFEKKDMDVTTAINGHQAFEILSKQTEDDLFDIVILDLNMPISDGFETCKNIIKFFKCQGIFKIDQSFVSNISSSHG
jgi:CheY-like chemotaxis protein